MPKQQLPIYLAGNIKKGKEDDNAEVWTKSETDLLTACIKNWEPLFLDPSSRSDDLSDQTSVFGRDLFQVYSSKLVLVDARGKRGLGVGAEMMFAKMNGIPVVCWVPEHSHYQRGSLQLLGQQVNGWIHPFVYNLSDFIAPTLEAIAGWIDVSLGNPNFKAKGPEILTASIRHYLATQLHQDSEMHELVASSPYFRGAVEGVRSLTAKR